MKKRRKPFIIEMKNGSRIQLINCREGEDLKGAHVLEDSFSFEPQQPPEEIAFRLNTDPYDPEIYR